jgi:hypothetical protein
MADLFTAGNPFTAAQANAFADGLLTGTYTPTLTAMVIGTGGGATNSATYTYSGGILVVQGQTLFGTSGQTFPGATAAWDTPPAFTVAGGVSALPVGRASLIDANGSIYDAALWYSDTNTIRLLLVTVSGANLVQSSPSTTTPFTWASGDSISYHYAVRAVRV